MNMTVCETVTNDFDLRYAGLMPIPREGGASGVQVENPILLPRCRAMGMTAYDNANIGPHRVYADPMQVMNHIDEDIVRLDKFFMGKPLRPWAQIHIATNGLDLAGFAKRLQNLRSVDITGVENKIHTT